MKKSKNLLEAVRLPRGASLKHRMVMAPQCQRCAGFHDGSAIEDLIDYYRMWLSMGGITITPNTEVVMKNGHILKGVYAAGEVAGGIHGANRIGGNAIADIVIFGIKAGDEAANFAKHHKKSSDNDAVPI